MYTNELLTIVKRKRSPVVLADSPKPLAVGDVCPHCGQTVTGVTNTEPLKPESEIAPAIVDAQPIVPSEPVAEAVVETAGIPKPKKSRAAANKN